MCSKNSSVNPRKPATTTPKPARKSRTKTRKPKYLSLKLELSPKQQKPIKMTHKQQLNLFPLHPENLVQDKDPINDDQVSDHVSFLFETATDTSASLHGILDSTTTTEEEPPYVYGGNEGGDEEKMVKTAMKCKERDVSEDRWVSYWEVVEKKEQEEVSSCSCCGGGDALEKMMESQDDDKKGLVGLKLDYQHILNAWSNKGPLYINGESPQTVPDLHPHHASNGLMDGWENLWRVPEMGRVKLEKTEEKEVWKLGQREASVLRYKEKRQSRLFAKRIRYEVRKLNAEKRPRLKGRFVKRNGEE